MYVIFVRKINKIPYFYIIARKKYFLEFYTGTCPPPPLLVSYADELKGRKVFLGPTTFGRPTIAEQY